MNNRFPAEEAALRFSYCATSGTVTANDGRTRKITLAGGRPGARYQKLSYGGRNYYVHHLVWAIHHGVWPERLDHRNRDRQDNRIENLRECSQQLNQFNAVVRSHNRSGFKGVYSVAHRCPHRPWLAKIVINGERVDLGYFADPETAARAYDKAARDHAGDFACTNF